ncbi:Upf3p KNAG_0K00990 [Huiozyma naganishii CBS 8797]|uniref:UPF3 domain-containing protein n=1 Tax=Huiozyma naganishii (strain ATCC MYA-139 / BCRC 22969 / CBS 8797 / KCTC 17520 / NBRC 10181 / NCYC 3082 / Yp74L-3) TaxID=1071383 RepID=J7SA69_HUIN7|nr:hypothetical protein KNAG_0K00990 [Kazachstania naganishii CBS 8797]CCK72464.1 hypothetical protein KNAG_0K00990 [Kazachstania naganishii CBS 8797]
MEGQDAQPTGNGSTTPKRDNREQESTTKVKNGLRNPQAFEDISNASTSPKQQFKRFQKKPGMFAARRNKAAESSQDESVTKAKGPRNGKANRGSNNNNRKKKKARGKYKESEGFRVVMRLLPPNLTFEELCTTLKTEITSDFVSVYRISDIYYVQGHYSVKAFNEPIFSRCYFHFDDMENLKAFVMKLQGIMLVDDRDNAVKPTIKLTPYAKKLSDTNPNGFGKSKTFVLEGSLEETKLFKNFMKSLKYIEKTQEAGDEGSLFNLLDGSISLLKPLEKELAKKKKAEAAVKRKTENALTELAGSIAGNNKNKKKKKKKTKTDKDASTGAGLSKTDTKNKKKKPKKSKLLNAKRTERNNAQDSTDKKNNNIVILEDAGKRELQKRKSLQKKKETEQKKSMKKLVPQSKKQPRMDVGTLSRYSISSQPFVPSTTKPEN